MGDTMMVEWVIKWIGLLLFAMTCVARKIDESSEVRPSDIAFPRKGFEGDHVCASKVAMAVEESENKIMELYQRLELYEMKNSMKDRTKRHLSEEVNDLSGCSENINAHINY